MKSFHRPSLLSWSVAIVLALLAFAPVSRSQETADASGKAVVVMKTSLGDMEIELNAAKAPITVKNFLEYVDAKSYDKTIFHRVIKGFMIQGGGFNAKMQKTRTRKPIKNEAANGLKNLRGSIAMARTSVVDSATNQFFIIHKDSDFLNHRDTSARGFGYCVFGRVTAGLEVLDKIAAVRTGMQGSYRDVPVETVLIESVRRK